MFSLKSKTFATAAIFGLALLSALAAASNGPLKVFILSGQSNMQGHAQLSTFGQSEGQQAEEMLYQELFNGRELVILRKGASNFEFHYLGSAKIVGQIGKTFAEAMTQLLKK